MLGGTNWNGNVHPSVSQSKKGEKTEKVLSASHIFSSTHAWPVWVVEELLHQKPVQPPLCCLQPAKPTPSHDETDIGLSSCFLKTRNDGNDNNLYPQDIYGMHVTQCLVRDGLGWSEQGLINEEGCPQVITITISASSSLFIIKGIVIIITQLLYHPDNCEHQDYEIMGELEYSSSKTTALVKFQAHKFPYTRFLFHFYTRKGSGLCLHSFSFNSNQVS